MNVLEQCKISPAPGLAVAPEILPLTFFDYLFLPLPPVTRVFFYDLPCSVPVFLENHLPQLKLSLSLALRNFRPLAGSLHPCSDGGRHEIRCNDLDAVPFTVAESGDDDFYDISGNHARDCTRFRSLVPPLLHGRGSGRPLLALQVTLFPGANVALGITISHAVADGTTTAHFLKAWAAGCRLPVGDVMAPPPPSYDRSVVRDPRDLERIFLRDLNATKDDRPPDATNLHRWNDVVRSTFVLGPGQIKKLRERFSAKAGTEYSSASSFALVSGFIWACLAKARGDSGGKTAYFGFIADGRMRLDPPAPPVNYFGNCLGIRRAAADGGDLEGEDGAVIATRAISEAIQGLKSGGLLQGAENWIRDMGSLASAWFLTVAGSPKLGLYQVDFGWGRPRKIEVVSIEGSGGMSMAEGAEEGSGIEIGLALPRDLMGRFRVLFADRLSEASSP